MVQPNKGAQLWNRAKKLIPGGTKLLSKRSRAPIKGERKKLRTKTFETRSKKSKGELTLCKKSWSKNN
jgi:hypothetical protein